MYVIQLLIARKISDYEEDENFEYEHVPWDSLYSFDIMRLEEEKEDDIKYYDDLFSKSETIHHHAGYEFFIYISGNGNKNGKFLVGITSPRKRKYLIPCKMFNPNQQMV